MSSDLLGDALAEFMQQCVDGGISTPFHCIIIGANGSIMVSLMRDRGEYSEHLCERIVAPGFIFPMRFLAFDQVGNSAMIVVNAHREN